ncbi:MAG: peptidylprolyl isomerase [Planctomycetota bacterium]|nr:peptidylprolyl isomerase [Planctomycetota bacterium]
MASKRHLLAAGLVLFCGSMVFAQEAFAQESNVVATIDGEPITSQQLDAFMLSRRIPKDLWPTVREKMVEQVIDRRLIAAYLDERSVKADQRQVDTLVGDMKKKIVASGEKPEDVFARLGLTEELLRVEIGLPLAWQAYVRSVLTADDYQDHFNEHRRELDGTEVRASQILVKVPQGASEADVAAAERQLKNLRQQIIDGKIEFAAAAKRYSQAPSGRNGGDVGFFPYTGVMPAEFSRVAFRLKDDTISDAFRTDFGWHICQVTERKPGDLSLEDARPEIFRNLTTQKWQEVVAAERKTARIERKTTKQKRAAK